MVNLVIVLVALLALASPVWSQDLAVRQVRGLAAGCASCHGTEGRAVDGSSVPGLAGQPAARLVEQMKAFRDGSRPATVMHQIAKGYTDEQVEQLAAYFEKAAP